jgi:molybdopterin converting factor small subunit
VAIVMVPALLRSMCGGAARVDAPGETLGAVLRSLDGHCPGIYDRVVDEGRVRPELAIALDGEAQALPLYHPLAPDAEITIVPAIGGG